MTSTPRLSKELADLKDKIRELELELEEARSDVKEKVVHRANFKVANNGCVICTSLAGCYRRYSAL